MEFVRRHSLALKKTHPLPISAGDSGAGSGPWVQVLAPGHRSFNVLSATSAHTIDKIQKRITTCVSGHPPSSK